MSPDQFLKRWRVRCFYHFTDERNLPSIWANGGLHCLAELRRRRIDVRAPGGNKQSHIADTLWGLDEFVHLCLLNEHPMEWTAKQEGRLRRTRFLEISPRVLFLSGVGFAKGVANKRGMEIVTLPEAVRSFDFDVLYEPANWSDPAVRERRSAAMRYELLVPGSIALSMIRGAD